MSNDPFDPFGQNERTIIRPQPGGRPAAPQPGARGATPPQAAPGRQPVQAPTNQVSSEATPISTRLSGTPWPLVSPPYHQPARCTNSARAAAC